MRRRIKRQDAVTAIEGKLEVTLVRTKEIHGWLMDGQRKILRFTLTPQHKGSELSPGAADRLRKESKLSENDFYDLIDCPLSREAYLAILEKRGLLKPTSE